MAGLNNSVMLSLLGTTVLGESPPADARWPVKGAPACCLFLLIRINESVRGHAGPGHRHWQPVLRAQRASEAAPAWMSSGSLQWQPSACR